MRIWTFFFADNSLAGRLGTAVELRQRRDGGVTCLGSRWISDLKELCRENFHNTVTILDRVNAKGRGRKNKDGISCIWLTNEYRTFGISLPPFYWGNYIGDNGVVLRYRYIE